MLKKTIMLAILIPLCLFAQYQRPGSTDAQFLKIDVSPRASAMGGSLISATTGAEAAFYNPAALARIPNLDLVFSHTQWFAGISHEFAAIAKNFGLIGTFGLSVTALYTDEMEVRTPLQPDGTGETFYSGNYRFALSYARHLTDQVTLGGNFSYVYMKLYDKFSADAVAVDIAILYVTHFRNFRFGMKIANFGSEVKYVNESYPLPTNFQFGMSMNAWQNESSNLLVSFAAVKPNDGQPLGLLGTEWNWRKTLFLRAGYHLNHEVIRYSFGGGLQWKISNYQLRFDYSYNDFSLLGGTHRFGIGIGYH